MKLCKRDLSVVIELRKLRPFLVCVALTASLIDVASAEGKFTDAEDGMFDLSDMLLSHRGVGLTMGIDVARGPGQNAFYVQVGNAWR